MRKKLVASAMLFVMAIGMGVGLSPSKAEAVPCQASIWCKNGTEIICWFPRANCPNCIVLGPC